MNLKQLSNDVQRELCELCHDLKKNTEIVNVASKVMFDEDNDQRMDSGDCLNNSDVINYYDTELEDASDLPNSLIVTSVDSRVFSSGDTRTEFEALFKKFEPNVTFQYFKSFKRVRVNYNNPLFAARARIECDQRKVGDGIINCYFGQMADSPSKEHNDNLLQPPSPVRQFLISPPASPPVGWQPCDEAHPIINYELLAALSNLTAGESHELHPPSESQPAIVVHICEDGEEDEQTKSGRSKIQQTKRPPLRSTSEGSEDSNDSMCVTPP
ncbi:Calcipressin-3-like protein [Leptotrombidium deliense]|uniref:Calcipressin-3-like protein n=1 Tax=Leptotrombidium deliense TaxID=299467 RepID=A0A443SFN9_9ACAR|nr:Calcipressin-3-like protein [Leptotrombidium deliense]